MTATEELRRMLDERVVEHFDGVECTFWGDTVLARRDGSCPVYRFSATEVADGVSVHLLRVSPEQAIEATLGRGTCHNLWDVELTGRLRFQCSKCEAVSLEITPRYCPVCGRQVVDDASVE